jgi:hypothetical protein
VSTAYNFDIESPTNISADSSKIRCDILNSVLNESLTLKNELIGNRFLHLEKPTIHSRVQKKEKNSLELMEELGLLGAIEDSEVTSKNYKEFIKKSFEKHDGKES